MTIKSYKRIVAVPFIAVESCEVFLVLLRTLNSTNVCMSGVLWSLRTLNSTDVGVSTVLWSWRTLNFTDVGVSAVLWSLLISVFHIDSVWKFILLTLSIWRSHLSHLTSLGQFIEVDEEVLYPTVGWFEQYTYKHSLDVDFFDVISRLVIRKVAVKCWSVAVLALVPTEETLWF